MVSRTSLCEIAKGAREGWGGDRRRNHQLRPQGLSRCSAGRSRRAFGASEPSEPRPPALPHPHNIKVSDLPTTAAAEPGRRDGEGAAGVHRGVPGRLRRRGLQPRRRRAQGLLRGRRPPAPRPRSRAGGGGPPRSGWRSPSGMARTRSREEAGEEEATEEMVPRRQPAPSPPPSFLHGVSSSSLEVPPRRPGRASALPALPVAALPGGRLHRPSPARPPRRSRRPVGRRERRLTAAAWPERRAR